MNRLVTPAKDLLTWLKDPRNLIAFAVALIPMYMVILYMDTYGRNVPVNDHWLFGIKIAEAAENGSLSLDVILQDFAGHRIFFTGTLHALLTYFTQWNTVYEMYVNLPLAMGEFALMVVLFRKQFAHLTAAALIPFSLIIFSVYQYLNWLNGFYTIWHFVPLFFLLTLGVIQRLKQGWLAIGLAVFFSICATFSLGPGVVVWAAMLIGLVLFGYRDWKHYAAYLGSLLLTVYVYTREVKVDVSGEGGGFSSLHFAPIKEMVTFFLTFLGNPFTAEYDHVIAYRLAIFGIVVLLVNLVYLWWQRRKLEDIATWVTLGAFAGGVAALITLTRYTEGRYITALEQRYTSISTYFWLAIIATGIAVIWEIWQSDYAKKWQIGVVGVNVILGMLLLGYYARSNIWNWQATAQRYKEKVALPYEEFNEEDCILQYPLTRDGTCVWDTFVVQLGNATPERIYEVAALKLTIFADQLPAQVLPTTYQPDDPIIIDSPSRWLNVYIRDWLLEGISEDKMLHIAPPEESLSTEVLPHPLAGQHLTEFDEPAVSSFIGVAEQLWYIYTPETEVNALAFDDFMQAQGYVPLYIPIRIEPYSSGKFTIIRYRQAPQETSTLFTFGKDITLQAWEIFAGESLAPCASLPIQTWWLVTAVPDQNYSATFMLINVVGEKVANVDGSPGGIEMQVWQPDLLYVDDRQLTVPCDLPAGDYSLAVGFYSLPNFDFLPVQDAVGEDIGTRAVLRTIKVE